MDSKVVLLAFLVFGVAVGEQNCPDGWVGPTSSGKCYQILHTATSPLDAGKLCENNGGKLGNIKNQIEQDFLNTYVFPDAKDWLITGLSRAPDATLWYWSDGAKADYQNWGTPSYYSGAGADPKTINYMYVYTRPTDKGTANWGKFYADRPVNHEVLCEVIPKNKDNGNGGGSCGCRSSCGCGC